MYGEKLEINVEFLDESLYIFQIPYKFQIQEPQRFFSVATLVTLDHNKYLTQNVSSDTYFLTSHV
jgi:hypothetical protein